MQSRNPEYVISVRVSGNILAAIEEVLTGTKPPESEFCNQCTANANWNEAAGYPELAERCRQYCRNAHRE